MRAHRPLSSGKTTVELGRRRPARAAAALTIALVAVAATACTSATRDEDQTAAGVDSAVATKLEAEGPVELIDSNIASQPVQAAVIASVINKFGGEAKTEVIGDIAAAWVQMSKTDNLVYPEMWKTLYESQWKEYIDGTKEVASVGASATNGEEGWYVPTYVIEGDPERGIEPTCPGLPDYKALNDCVDVFKTPKTGDKGQYLEGAAAWGPYYGDPQRIESLGLNYEIVYAGSEAALQAEWKRAYDQGKPILALMWRPHYVTLKYDVTRVEFPEYTPDCWGEGKSYACNWAPIDIYNLASGDFATQHPLANEIVQKYNLSDDELKKMMLWVTDDGMTPQEAADRWVDENEDVWKAWAPTAQAS